MWGSLARAVPRVLRVTARDFGRTLLPMTHQLVVGYTKYECTNRPRPNLTVM